MIYLVIGFAVALFMVLVALLAYIIEQPDEYKKRWMNTLKRYADFMIQKHINK